MPAMLVRTISEETGIPIAEAENRWKKAKDIAHDQKGLSPTDGDAYWKYVTGVFKKSMGISEDGAVLESIVQPDQISTVSQDQSRKVMKFTLDTQKNTMEGIFRPGVGWIAFLWGAPGKDPLFADGDGLSRIVAKQDFERKYLNGAASGRELCMRLVDIATRGYIKRKYGPTSNPKIDITWQGEIATLAWDKGRQTWYLSAWRQNWGGILESADGYGSHRQAMNEEWRTMILDAKSFKDIYAAFQQAEIGVLSYLMPAKPEDAEKVFDAVSKLEPFVAEIDAAKTDSERVDVIVKANSALHSSNGSLYTASTLEALLPGYRKFMEYSKFLPGAGKEIFEKSKAKGDQIVSSWMNSGGYKKTAQLIEQKQAESYEANRQWDMAYADYNKAESSAKERTGYTKAAYELDTEVGAANKRIKELEEKVKRLPVSSAEWVTENDNLTRERELVIETSRYFRDAFYEKLDLFRKDEEYRQAKKDFFAKEEEYTARMNQINKDVDEIRKTRYDALTSKILESSPITEEQASKWASAQVIEKSVISTLKKNNYTESQLRADMAELYRLSGGRFGKCFILPRAKGQSRACAETSNRIIHIGSHFDKKTLWHEMGHLFEADQKYNAAAATFLDGRVDRSKGLQKLKKLTGNPGYRNDEVAYTDHLFDPYVGKFYRHGSTEVLSMGVQQFSSPSRIAELEEKDPEMLKFIAGLLATPPNGAENERFSLSMDQVDAEKEEQRRNEIFYKALEKKIKANPAFYKPFAVFEPYRGYRGRGGYGMVYNISAIKGPFAFNIRYGNKKDAMFAAYLVIAIMQTPGGVSGAKRLLDYGTYDISNKKIPEMIVKQAPEWAAGDLPDIDMNKSLDGE